MAKITVHGGPSPAPEWLVDVLTDVESVPATGDADDVPTEQTVSVAAPDYDGWLVADLSDELKHRGLPYTGTKVDLVARLVEDDVARRTTIQE